MASEKQIILNFHGIGQPHAGVDDNEHLYWVSEAFFTDIVDMAAARPDRDRIVWTFDDGNLSDFAIGAKILRKHGFTAEFFLLSGRLGKTHYLSSDDALALREMGMSIGLHGRDHVDWRRIDDDVFARETVEARAVLERAANCRIDAVAIPFGAYNRSVISRLKRLGFTSIFTSDGGTTSPHRRIRSRTSIRGNMTLAEVAAIMDGRQSLTRRLKRAVSMALRRHLM